MIYFNLVMNLHTVYFLLFIFYFHIKQTNKQTTTRCLQNMWKYKLLVTNKQNRLKICIVSAHQVGIILLQRNGQPNPFHNHSKANKKCPKGERNGNKWRCKERIEWFCQFRDGASKHHIHQANVKPGDLFYLLIYLFICLYIVLTFLAMFTKLYW